MVSFSQQVVAMANHVHSFILALSTLEAMFLAYFIFWNYFQCFELHSIPAEIFHFGVLDKFRLFWSLNSKIFRIVLDFFKH